MGQLREVADEVFIAADARTGHEDLEAYAGVADRVSRYEYRGQGRDLAWLHAQCSGDWIFRIDADEVASPDLIEQLPELVADRNVVQYWFPTGWLFPDAAHFLVEDPWWPDFHNRLVRNDGTLRFPGLQHTGAEPVYPCRYIDTPIYHLDLILSGERERAEKAGRYDSNRAGIVGEDGRPLNQTLYQPERHAHRAPADAPARDRDAIAEVLEARPPAGSWNGRNGQAAGDEVVSRSEIERHWAFRLLSADAYRARLAPVSQEVQAAAGGHRSVFVRVHNEGDEVWPWGSTQHPQIQLGYRLRDSEGTLIDDEGPRSLLPKALAPGEWTIAPVAVLVPVLPGSYALEVDLVHEPFRWFGRATTIELQVSAGAVMAENGRSTENGERSAALRSVR
jgi:hypothetical protein